MSAAHNGISKEHPLMLRRRARADKTFLAALRTLTQITEAEAKPRRMTAKFTPKPGESFFSGIPSIAETFKSIGTKNPR